MPEISEYQPGTPCWLDLWTPDRQASMDFYAAVFGWEYEVGTEDQHNYTTARRNGKTVAGLLTPPGNADGPMVWLPYLATDDVEAVVGAVQRGGGQSLTGAIDAPGGIRIALATDPAGGLFGAMQATGRRGIELANEAGTLVWNELMTPDAATARTFFAAVFGVEISDPFEGVDYTTIRAAGRDVGGIGQSDDGRPAAWNTFFATDDADASAELVRANGGSLLGEIVDTPYGRMAPCADPQGATFYLMRPPTG